MVLAEFQMPKATYPAAVLAFFKLLNWNIPDKNGPLTVSVEEEATLARQVIAAASEYLPEAERQQFSALKVNVAKTKVVHSFRASGALVASSETVDGAPGCQVGMGHHVVNIRLPGHH